MIFFKTKYTNKVQCLVEYYALKMDIMRYYLLPNFTRLKRCNQKYILKISAPPICNFIFS